MSVISKSGSSVRILATPCPVIMFMQEMPLVNGWSLLSLIFTVRFLLKLLLNCLGALPLLLVTVCLKYTS